MLIFQAAELAGGGGEDKGGGLRPEKIVGFLITKSGRNSFAHDIAYSDFRC